MKKETTKQPGKAGHYGMVALYMLMGGVCGMILVESSHMTAGFAAFLVIFLLEVILHEGGHMIFGLATGYRLCSFRIFSFLWRKENGRFVCKRLSLAGTAGQCLMDPPEMKGDTFPYVLYNLGGILMNLLTIPVFLVLWKLSPPDSLLATFSLIGVAEAAALALTNGLPLRTKDVSNDGSNILAMKRSPSARRAFWIQLRITALTADGIPLKDMPDDWFPDPATASADNVLEATLPVSTCNRLLNQGRISEARGAIQALLDRETDMNGLHRFLLVCDLATCRLLEGEDGTDLLSSRDQIRFRKSMKKFPSVLRTEYVLALLGENDEKEAESIRARFDAVARTYPYESDIAMERELMELAASRYKETHE